MSGFFIGYRHYNMYRLRISNIIEQPNQNVTIEFEDIDKNYPKPLAGQFLTLIFNFNAREVRRSYSFNSSPHWGEPLSITVKRIDNGEISRFLHHKTRVGDVVDVLQPQGLFTYMPHEDNHKTIVLFAAGVGITPLYSILKSALAIEKKSKIVLVYSNSSVEKTLFYSELKELEQLYADRLSIIWIFSSSKNLLKARLNRDFINEIIRDYFPVDKEDCLIYTCGPVIYMDLCRFTLLGQGFTDAQIFRETFQLPENEEDDDDESEPEIDTTSYDITILFEGQSYDYTVPYNKTILEVGLENGLKLPYSCKSGMCSTCISQCSKGSVRMVYNEVLTDREVNNGRCLICTSHPTEDGTVIEVY